MFTECHFSNVQSWVSRGRENVHLIIFPNVSWLKGKTLWLVRKMVMIRKWWWDCLTSECLCLFRPIHCDFTKRENSTIFIMKKRQIFKTKLKLKIIESVLYVHLTLDKWLFLLSLQLFLGFLQVSQFFSKSS